jgi:hypothetical protein
VNQNPYKPPTTPPERPAVWPPLAVGTIAGGLLGSTSGTLCALVLSAIHLAIETPGSWAITLVSRGVQSAIVGSLVGLLWGGILGVIGVILNARASSGPEFKRTFVLTSSFASGFVGGAAGMYFNWLMSNDSPTFWIAVGSALGVVSGVWASRRFTRVLVAR